MTTLDKERIKRTKDIRELLREASRKALDMDNQEVVLIILVKYVGELTQAHLDEKLRPCA